MSRYLSLTDIRSEACNKTLVAFTILSAPLLLISLSRALEQGWQPLLTGHAMLFTIMVALTLGRQRLPLVLRAGFLVGLMVVLGIGGMLTYGLGTGAITYFIAACLFAAAFFSMRMGISVVVASCVFIMALWSGHAQGLVPEVVDPNLYKYNFTSWLGAAANVIFCACGAMYALSAVTRALDAERQRADEAANARAQFLARMSHELRTPMTGVIGMAELLQGTKLSPEQTTMTSRLLRAARSLLDLLNDVLDFSKVEAGRVVVETAAFRISDVITEISDLFGTTAQQNNIILSTHLPAAYTDAVIGDRFKVGQVLSNLVSNALKFTPHGKVSVEVAQTINADGIAMTTFSVTDTGIGISPDELARLFQPFVQADSSTTRKYGGSGLGLVISKNLVQAMGGELMVNSSPGRGSAFSFTLPMQPDRTAAQNLPTPTPAPAAAAIPAPPSAGQPLLQITPGLRVLLVDDDPMVHTLMKIVLEDAKAHVTSADNGAKAVDAVKRNAFDLILIDMHMPVMDGITATRGIRAVETARTTPVIALTADIISSGKAEVLIAGANAVVSKPIVWPQLQAEINAVLKAA